jgi:hypothetical protein
MNPSSSAFGVDFYYRPQSKKYFSVIYLFVKQRYTGSDNCNLIHNSTISSGRPLLK